MGLFYAAETVLRKDWYGEVTVYADGSVTRVPGRHHRMCGTCVSEYALGSGYFESELRRKQVGDVLVLPVEQREKGGKDFCCNCGQLTKIDAVFEMTPNQVVCDGLQLHERPSEEESDG